MTAAADPYATFRPRRGRLVADAVAGTAVLVFGVLALVMPSTGYQGWSATDSVLLFAFGLLIAAGLWRFARLRAVPTSQGIVVRNVLLTRQVAWPEVSRVRFGTGDAWVWLELQDGDEVAVMAIQRSDGLFGVDEACRLAALVEANGAGGRPS